MAPSLSARTWPPAARGPARQQPPRGVPTDRTPGKPAAEHSETATLPLAKPSLCNNSFIHKQNNPLYLNDLRHNQELLLMQ